MLIRINKKSMDRVTLDAQILGVSEKQKKDGTGSYYIISGSVVGGVFETFLSPELYGKLESQEFPMQAQLVFEPSAYQARINWRLVDVI